MKKLLWLDDIRNPLLDTVGKVPKNEGRLEIEWVLDYSEFISYIDRNGLPDIISFDHDLGDIGNHKEKTGYDCAKYLVDYCIDNNKLMPKFYVHSDNTVGAKNIISLLNNYIKNCQ